jgi:hypothetical protein
MEIDAVKACLEQIGLERGDILIPLVIGKVVESMTTKRS